jgi:hypothetical protein
LDLELKRKFIERWRKYFGGSELPITFYYAGQKGSVELVKPPSGHQCFIGVLSKVRKGLSLSFDVNSIFFIDSQGEIPYCFSLKNQGTSLIRINRDQH